MMKKITKFVTLLLALAMVFSLAACSSGKGKDKADGSADIATLIATEPNSADEAAKLYQQLMQKENEHSRRKLRALEQGVSVCQQKQHHDRGRHELR